MELLYIHLNGLSNSQFTFAFLLVTVVVQQSIGHLLGVLASFFQCVIFVTSDMERRGDLGSPGGRGWHNDLGLLLLLVVILLLLLLVGGCSVPE